MNNQELSIVLLEKTGQRTDTHAALARVPVVGDRLMVETHVYTVTSVLFTLDTPGEPPQVTAIGV